MNPTGPSGSREANPPPETTRHVVFRSVTLAAVLAACTLLAALVGFGVVGWRGIHHLEPVDRHLEALTRLQQTSIDLEEVTIEGLDDGGLSQPTMQALRREIAAVSALPDFLAPDTPRELAAAEAALAGGGNPRVSLLTAVERIRGALAAEVLAHGALLDQVRSDLVSEFSVGAAAVITLSGLGVLTLLLMRRRIFQHLNTLEQLLSLLAKQDYSLAPTEGIDPLVKPLTTSYNRLVNRLMALEAENARHRDTLEHEVRTVTETLLEQHRNLATAERLAATGEMAARIAHELRNPLAGMQMALGNIRAEFRDRDDVVQRMDLVIDELRRVTGLLNGLLDQSRITAEPAVDVSVAGVVGDLLSVLRYQIPKNIALEEDIPEGLVCRLPKDRFRQVLLNLILNSSQAIGEESGRISVRARAAGGELEISVSDSGPGFPQSLLDQGIGLFRSNRPGGIGLGLSIVSRLVSNLDGSVLLTNLEPRGACVRLTLPCGGTHA
jgi:signal transduction histidine kinase